MGGKKAAEKKTLARALIKRINEPRNNNQSMRHTQVLDDGIEKMNLQSITEYTQLDEILDHRNQALNDFQAVKVSLAKTIEEEVTPGFEQLEALRRLHEQNKFLLGIPRRPAWSPSMTEDELHFLEKEEFSKWRKQLAILEEEKELILTPYERNLDFWRQLWRVIERSDILVQILDARNPLLFRCEDLERYVKEVDPNKDNILLMNKCDLLTEFQRKAWADYFNSQKITVLFFSALQEAEGESKECDTSPEALDDAIRNGLLLSREQLIAFLRTAAKDRPTLQKGVTTIGLVGYPNIGKSSTINALLQCKAVSVSATPGKTKHFQTLFLEPSLQLCDCPGLVFPSFVNSKAELVINGIMSIDYITNYMKAMMLIASLIPRHVFESIYHIYIERPKDEREDTGYATAEEVLNAYGYMRGFMTQRGLPDGGRASRYIVKDFITGKLLYCKAPPGVDQDTYHPFPEPDRDKTAPPPQIKIYKEDHLSLDAFDRQFFAGMKNEAHIKPVSLGGMVPSGDKSWKKNKKKPKKEKLRKVYVY